MPGAITHFRDSWHHAFNVDVRRCSVYQDVSSQIAPNGIEYYLPFFFPQLGTLFDYLPENVLIVVEEGVIEAAEHNLQETQSRYDALGHDIERPILPPTSLFLVMEEIFHHLNQHPRIELSSQPGKHNIEFFSHKLPDLEFNARTAHPAEKLHRFLEAVNQPVLFVAESAGRREMFDELLQKAGVSTQIIDSFEAFKSSQNHCITLANFDEGLHVDDCIVITESNVLGTRQADPRRESGGRILDPDQIVKNLTELSVGAAVVHIDHGVGRYQGLQTLTINGDTHEFLTLFYADEDKLYVPVTSLHLISRYAGSDEENAPLHRLGSDHWEKAKRKAAEKVIDVAAELLDIYARRELRTSYRFELNEDDYKAFANEFAFEVTLDQQGAIDDTVRDMTTVRAMDRLICGDVGFGKTEVAMRAAFLAVQNNKQVAVLVPTTLLAQQHFDSFKDRFANWPIAIETISRLRSQPELDAIAAQSISGKVDILIGTHKLLSNTFKFKDLGLIVIDEEHRFGVRQKERLKAMRAEGRYFDTNRNPNSAHLKHVSFGNTRPLDHCNAARQTSVDQNICSTKTKSSGRRGHWPRTPARWPSILSTQCGSKHQHSRRRNRRLGARGHASVLVMGQMPKRALEQVMADFYHRRLNVLGMHNHYRNGPRCPQCQHHHYRKSGQIWFSTATSTSRSCRQKSPSGLRLSADTAPESHDQRRGKTVRCA